MKRYVIALLIAVLLLVVACTPEAEEVEEEVELPPESEFEVECPTAYNPICGEDGLTYQNSCFSSNRDVGVAYVGVCEYDVCAFNGQDHYLLNNMLYYEDNLGRPYINLLYGTFRLQADGEGWTYVKAINKNASYYTNRMLEYDNGVTESGNEIVCRSTTDMPEQLKEFLKTHGHILELKIESYKEQGDIVETVQEEAVEVTEEVEN